MNNKGYQGTGIVPKPHRPNLICKLIGHWWKTEQWQSEFGTNWQQICRLCNKIHGGGCSYAVEVIVDGGGSGGTAESHEHDWVFTIHVNTQGGYKIKVCQVCGLKIQVK